MEVIRKFLEDVVHVVPIESIAYAIAYSPYEIAMLCYVALRSSGVKLPYSKVMHDGFRFAAQRLGQGITVHLLKKLKGRMKEENPESFSGFSHEAVLLLRDEVQLIQRPRVPGTHLPSSHNVATATVKLQPEEVESAVNLEAGTYISQLSQEMRVDYERKNVPMPQLTGQNIDCLYPIG